MPVQHVDSPISSTPGSGLDRRSFLRKAATGLGASAVLSLPGVAQAAEAATRKKVRTAYRLSTHRMRACTACKGTAANRFYVSADAANRGRAHLGCNCRIVTEDLPKSTWTCYFRGGSRRVYDLRWHLKCPPPP
jgi:hypothetical protein